MKRLAWATMTAGALFLAGCSDDTTAKVKYDPEAIALGYKGMDTEVSDPMFFTTAPTVTNWVPARVLSVSEDYELAPGELKLIADAGVIAPGEDLAEIPAGYEKKDVEPWFTTWTRPASAFGFEGVAGFLSHYDEDRKVWLTSEGYFSSYWKTEAEARTALAQVKEAIREGYGVRKFHDFDGCWVAEYVRLRVMAVVGQKADGTWSCMLDVQDKKRMGCGQWEPVEDQQQRLEHHVLMKAVRAWRADVAKVLEENHAAVEASRVASGLKDLDGASEWQMFNQLSEEQPPCMYRMAGGAITNALDVAWEERLAWIKDSLALSPEGTPVEQKMEDGSVIRATVMRDARYEVRLDAILRAEATDASESETAAAKGEWRLLCLERLQSGFVFPKRPAIPTK